MVALLRRLLLAAALSLGALSPALALSAEESAALTQIAQTLSGIRTMNGAFVQYDPDETERQGKFYIERPGKVRFQYDPPATVSVVSDGDQVLVYDKAMQTYDLWPLSQTPLRLLLDSNLNLATSDRVTKVTLSADIVEVELHDETRFSAGVLDLVFDRASNELRQWTVTDQQGLQTTVVLYGVEIGNQLSADLFTIDYMAATNAARERQTN
jgi:outer membrane lipoprotein-sorting protein